MMTQFFFLSKTLRKSTKGTAFTKVFLTTDKGSYR